MTTVNRKRVYLDWNATAPPLAEALSAMVAAAGAAWGNPSSVHTEGRTALRCVEDARSAVASLVGADPRDVVFVSGATEANNLALRAAFPDASRPAALVTSRLEHPSVVRVAEALAREGRAEVRWVDVTSRGQVDASHLASLLAAGDVRLLAIQAVNSETGVVSPLLDIAARARAAGVMLHVDAAQAWGRVPWPPIDVDTVCLAGHKLQGPKGIGALVFRAGRVLPPLLLGGSQERGIRPGTVDPVAAAGLAVAARHASGSVAAWSSRAPLRDRLESGLLALGAVRNVPPDEVRAPHVSSVGVPGWGSAELVAALDLEGVAISGGSACSAGTLEPSPVIAAMHGVPRARCSVRVSLGETTSDEDVSFALKAFARVLSRGGH